MRSQRLLTVRAGAVAALLVAATAGAAIAQERVTVQKRDGSRVAGQLEALGDGHVWVRASQADQQKLPLGDVVVIDFAGDASGLPEAETSQARGASHVLFMRDGTTLHGRLVGMQGGEGSGQQGPRVALFQEPASGTPRSIEANRVSRIYLGNYPAAAASQATPATATAQAAPAGAIRIPANQGWTQTPLTVRQGERLTFKVSGRITLSDNDQDVAESAGSFQGRMAPNSPLPGNLAGALIARVGNGQPFPIGNVETPVTMPATGPLWLGINDDNNGDNKGEFNVQIQRASRR